MAGSRLTKFELHIMETLWTQGEASIRQMRESFTETTLRGEKP
jgi:predicted transcriptional regulator